MWSEEFFMRLLGRARFARIVFLLLALLACTKACAHKPSDSYLTLHVAASEIVGQWDIALRDLDLALALDADQDGAITWREVRARHTDIAAYALSHLQLLADGDACVAGVDEHLVDRHSDGAYTVLRFSARCPHVPTTLEVRYRLLFDLDLQHHGLLQLDSGGRASTAIFTPEAPSQRFELAAPNRVRQFFEYVRHGVWHIWIGFDHILFLLSLLLPAVLVRNGTGWAPAEGAKAAAIDVLKVVTAFTLAHSITLTLAALSIVTLPSRLVESAIAVSVVLAALNNLYPVVSERRWLLAFTFGLIHGFGFASVLSDLGLPRGTLLTCLVAFNVGVELGQLTIVAAFLPAAWILRRSWVYRRVTLYVGSAAVALLALTWLVERAFDLRLMS
jgi:hypothetical protein